MIIYIGNKLLKHGYTPTSVETLGPLLSKSFNIKIYSDKKNKILRYFDVLYQIIKNRKKTELILIDTYSSLNFYYAFSVAVLAKFLSIPYIPILRGGSLIRRVEQSPKMSKQLFANSAINISPSKYLNEYFNNKDFSQTIYIPNNIDISIYPFKERKDIKPKILYVRAFHKIYNPMMAIRVLSKVLEKYPNAELCMVGPDKDGSLEDVKKLAEELNVVDKVTFTGRLEKEKWIELSKEYDIFINTTNFDNQPVSVIEAMALGFPIVSTDAGGMPYLMEDKKNGIIVKKENINAMVDAIELILEDANFANQLSLAARSSAEEFDWDNVQTKWIEIIDMVSRKC